MFLINQMKEIYLRQITILNKFRPDPNSFIPINRKLI